MYVLNDVVVLKIIRSNNPTIHQCTQALELLQLQTIATSIKTNVNGMKCVEHTDSRQCVCHLQCNEEEKKPIV